MIALCCCVVLLRCVVLLQVVEVHNKLIVWLQSQAKIIFYISGGRGNPIAKGIRF